MSMSAIQDVCVENALCSRYRTTRSECRRCERVCPAEAIRLSDRGVEIDDRCTGCGVCHSACPNGAFRLARRDDRQVTGKARMLLAGAEDARLRVTCERAAAAGDLVLPCLGRLTEAILLSALADGAADVEILQPDCAECPLQRAAANLEGVLVNVRGLSEVVGIDPGRVRRSPAGKPTSSAETTEREVPRRVLLRGLIGRAVEAAVPEPLLPTPPEPRTIFRDEILKRSEDRKRAFLVETLRRFPARRPVEIPCGGAPLADVTVGNQCSGCNVCEILCPTGAIVRDETEGVFRLDFRPSACTNCGVCEAVCLPKAIRVREKVDLSLVADAPARRLIEGRKRPCSACGMEVLGGADGICGLCANREAAVVAATT